MRVRTVLLLAGVLLLGIACDESQAQDYSKGVDEAVAEGAPDYHYDIRRAVEKLQGSWTNGSEMSSGAWKFDGSRVTYFDGEVETTYKLDVFAPCAFSGTKADDSAGNESITTQFVVGGEHKYLGAGFGGVVTEEGAIACLANGIFELTDSGCKRWSPYAEGSSEAECSLEKGTFRGPEGRELEKKGDVLIDENMQDYPLKSYDSFEKAKAAVRESQK